MKIVLILLIISFSIALLPTPVTISDSLVDESNADENNTELQCKIYSILSLFNSISPERIFDVLLLIIGILIGFIFNFLLYKRTLRFADIVNRSNEIKAIFVNTFVEIDNFNVNSKISIGDIVVDNINATETLIQQFFFYVGNSKREEIAKHYQEYINPYFTTKSKFNLSYFMYSEKMIKTKPSKFGKTEIKDEKERTLSHLKILINDFSKT